jgi:hypothetical protein
MAADIIPSIVKRIIASPVTSQGTPGPDLHHVGRPPQF